MSSVIPGFSHASVERLCDYELPEPPAPALREAAETPGPENLALAWWLWMDELGKSMFRHYDTWRDQLGRTADGPARKG